jgi:hypothetical protein
MIVISVALLVVLLLFASELGWRALATIVILWVGAYFAVVWLTSFELGDLFHRPGAGQTEDWAMARWFILVWELLLLVVAGLLLLRHRLL